MPNPERAEVAITLNGVTYDLKFDFNAICEAEDCLGGPVIKTEMGFRELRALVWAGIGKQVGRKRPTVAEVGALFKNMKDFERIQEKIGVALEAFIGVEEPPAEGAASAESSGEG